MRSIYETEDRVGDDRGHPGTRVIFQTEKTAAQEQRYEQALRSEQQNPTEQQPLDQRWPGKHRTEYRGVKQGEDDSVQMEGQ